MEYDMDLSSATTQFEGLEPFSSEIFGNMDGGLGSPQNGNGLFEYNPVSDGDLESLWNTAAPDSEGLYNFDFASEQDLEPLTDYSLLPPLQPYLDTDNITTISPMEALPELPPIKTENYVISDKHLSKVTPAVKKQKVQASPTMEEVKLVQVKKPEQKEANKMSAQASRQRKKDLKDQLERQVQDLTFSNQQIDQEIIELRTENRVLRNECFQLQQTISRSMTMNRPGMDKTGSHRAITTGTTPTAPIPVPLAVSQQHQAVALMYMMLMLQSINGASTPTPNTVLPIMSALGIAH